ncbi:MAG: N-succinyl-L,L-diaminopimelate aminotransferase (EC, type 2 [Candidatus Burkholderia crenata]|nr:MAG: N-succinyl-L,L-diaminopimelate aminotransferase (EC, type 2 [Candidatus Burkholderia crenata]
MSAFTPTIMMWRFCRARSFYLARDAHGTNPGSDFIRIALVVDVYECVEGARRIVEFCRTLAQ